MKSWVAHEMKAVEMPDKRLETRLSKILDVLSRHSNESIPASCQGWAETKAIYRFCDNQRVDMDDILSVSTRLTDECLGFGVLRRPTSHIHVVVVALKLNGMSNVRQR